MQEFIGKHSESVNSINPGGSSPLILAAYYGNEGTALLLSDKVKDINYNSGRGTALMAAVMNGNLTIIKKLISVNADLNASDNEGKTALMYAVYFNKNEIAKVLIDKGANKSLKDKEGKTALDVARFNKNTTLSILLDQ
ncbi:ankyrin repeat-containing protein [Flavobacterium noncentrifugens]|nr:ankyrin repeat-containing protein [Flavobacterium noncentrifugens]